MKTIKTVVTFAFIATLATAVLAFWPASPPPALNATACPHPSTACAQQLVMTYGWPRLN
ncbi:hypothetical protein [Pseudomonas ogarae]|uniref:hypothetical protein n=1 Tax=Pseudomonas ogarae (strain DSM 112162 / CECT 30235 / F113) TaxID=1114970 RepID=UPI0003084A16|nr:hypothetical protein [Pseudomonas ogarae]